MTLPFDISPSLQRTLDKLGRKDKKLAITVRKKIDQIINLDKTAIDHFKNLRGDMSHLKRVRIGSFILTFRLEGNTIIFEDFDHHDGAYRR
ncbi:MAG: type II toxin-antitoxin system mRNA interferase toxin, RelE/StbE family [Candidatus Altiarchaeota archaeon]|nr:type II toxin-antitoxin system mRNA interferase toxin, RelE/StbE family [Candidatus Altiarchaeota archaeon]